MASQFLHINFFLKKTYINQTILPSFICFLMSLFGSSTSCLGQMIVYAKMVNQRL